MRFGNGDLDHGWLIRIALPCGTVQWAWGLDAANPSGGAVDRNMQQATVNLLADMGGYLQLLTQSIPILGAFLYAGDHAEFQLSAKPNAPEDLPVAATAIAAASPAWDPIESRPFAAGDPRSAASRHHCRTSRAIAPTASSAISSADARR